jgi:hypothetical protein
MVPINSPDNYKMRFVMKLDPMEKKTDKIVIAELNCSCVHN